MVRTRSNKHRYRALFISDVHLGTRSAQAGALLEFLKETDADAVAASKAWTDRDRSAIYGGFHLYVKRGEGR